VTGPLVVPAVAKTGAREDHPMRSFLIRGATVRKLIIAVVLVAPVVTGSAAAQVPPGSVSEYHFVPDAAPAGGSISVDGTCRFGDHPATGVLVRLARTVSPGSGKEPFDTSKVIAVNTDGTFGGQLPIPAEAPPDQYHLVLACQDGDVLFGQQQFPFTVEPGTSPPANPITAKPVLTG
jgi:hypothetical protein